jgi:PAS domain
MSEKRRAGDHESELEELREKVRALRERAERAEGRFGAVVDNAPDGMIVFEHDGTPVFANRAMRALLAVKDDGRAGAGGPAELVLSTAGGPRRVTLRVVPAEWDGHTASLLVLSGTEPVAATQGAPTGGARRVPDREPPPTSEQDSPRLGHGSYRFCCAIDELAGIRSSLGVAVADELLAVMGQRLEQEVRAREAPKPLSDGSFEVECGGLDAPLAELVAKRLRAAMQAPTTIGGVRLGISATVDYHPLDQAGPHSEAGRSGPRGTGVGDKRDRLRGALFTAGDPAGKPGDTTQHPSDPRRSSPGVGHLPT